jgi:hypothetical protein
MVHFLSIGEGFMESGETYSSVFADISQLKGKKVALKAIANHVRELPDGFVLNAFPAHAEKHRDGGFS